MFFSRSKVFIEKFPTYLLHNSELLDTEIEKIAYLYDNATEVVKFNINQCILCKNPLGKLIKKKYLGQIYFHGKSSKQCYIISFKCSLCEIIHFPSYYITKLDVRKFYDNACDQKFISFTNESVFEVLLLKSLTTDIVFKHASFSNLH